MSTCKKSLHRHIFVCAFESSPYAGNSVGAVFGQHVDKAALRLDSRQLNWLLSQIHEPSVGSILALPACVRAIGRHSLTSRVAQLLDGRRRAFSRINGRTVYRDPAYDDRIVEHAAVRSPHSPYCRHPAASC